MSRATAYIKVRGKAPVRVQHAEGTVPPGPTYDKLAVHHRGGAVLEATLIRPGEPKTPSPTNCSGVTVGIRNFSLQRKPTSYWRVQAVVGALMRNRSLTLRRERLSNAYVDLGCGSHLHKDFINIDYHWMPGIDACWDISNGIPLPDDLAEGIFSEHCLEHFHIRIADRILGECKRVLKSGGVLRLIVPDAELYLRRYVERISGVSEESFPFEGDEAYQGFFSPILSVNRVYYQDRRSTAGHQTMFDFALLDLLLRKNGFRDVRRCTFRQGRDPVLLIDTPSRQPESLYVEAIS